MRVPEKLPHYLSGISETHVNSRYNLYSICKVGQAKGLSGRPTSRSKKSAGRREGQDALLPADRAPFGAGL